ncbi:hypothetical protein Plhal304r1_c004g0016081 [Plasmopara halstedii]
MTTRTHDRGSAGQILRLVGDSTLIQIEAAVAGVRRAKTGVRSSIPLIPVAKKQLSQENGLADCTDDADTQERADEGQLLSLMDHKRITRLQAGLDILSNAYDASDKTEALSDHNLVYVVAGAAMKKSMQDCTASSRNCCIWGAHAGKYHVLLDWMMSRELVMNQKSLVSCDYVHQLLLEWIQPTAEKQDQLASCLTLFELLRRRRLRLMCQVERNEVLPLSDIRVDAYVDALHRIVHRGTSLSAGSHRIKLSKLGLIALETLGMLCGDVAMQHLIYCESAKVHTFVEYKLMHKIVKSMQFSLDILRRWHSHSIRRQFLRFALQHLQSYVLTCDIVFSSVEWADGDCKIINNRVNLDVLCWHWVTTVPILCTRTHAISAKTKHRSFKVLTQILKLCNLSFIKSKDKSDQNDVSSNPEIVYSQSRHVCILLDSMGGLRGCLQAFENISQEAKADFVCFFVQILATATKDGNIATTQLSANVLRVLLLPDDVLKIFSSKDDEQGFLSQLIRLNGDSLLARGESCSELEAQTELELFISDFIISRELFITELQWALDKIQTSSLTSTISLVRTFLYQLDGLAAQIPLFRYWRKLLTQGILKLITHQKHKIYRLATSSLPTLDAVHCIAGLIAIGVYEADNRVISSSLEFLLKISTRSSLETTATWFIDACQYSNMEVHLGMYKALPSPHDWSEFAVHLFERYNNKTGACDEQNTVQHKLLSSCLRSPGWSHHVNLAHARHEILRVLVRKFLGSPRDHVILRMLREVIVCSWVSHEEFDVMATQICSHVANATRLTEELLNSDSSSATNAIKDLLFARLAPLLVLRMFPQTYYEANGLEEISCGREDLDHLNKYVEHHLQLDGRKLEAMSGNTTKVLFHILARSIVDPLEFKEVKMLAIECLSTLPFSLVLPFVLSYVVAFLREIMPYYVQDNSLIVQEDSVPMSCGLVTAKLMVYYLNRVFSGGEVIYANCEATLRAIALFIQILAIPFDDLPLTDLKRGSIECMALILSSLAARSNGPHDSDACSGCASALLNLFVMWIFGHQSREEGLKISAANAINLRVINLLGKMWSDARRDQLPIQARVWCCDVLTSAISRSEHGVLASWKKHGLMTRIVLATQKCPEEIAAGGFQIILSFMHKASNLFSTQDVGDISFALNCLEAAAVCLQSTRNEILARNGLKVVEVLGKFRVLAEALQPRNIQLVVDRSLVKVRDQRISFDVTMLAQSLLEANAILQ